MKYQITKEFPHPIMDKGKSPVVSIYIDTNVKKPDRLENSINFKNLVKEVKESLKDKTFRGYKDLFTLFEELERDALFWEGATEGMAILGDDEECVVYKLPLSVANRAIVADSFYLKPLLKNYQSSGLYHILGLNRERISLYEADRYGLHQIELDEKDATIEGVLGDEKTTPHLIAASMGGDQFRYHGQGGAKAEKKVDQEKFFKYISSFIQEQYSNPYKIPLILVGLDQHQGDFRKISKNPYMIAESIKGDIESMDEKMLYEKVQEVMKIMFKQQMEERTERFSEAHTRDLASDDVVQIARAITEGRVAELYLEENKVHPGQYDPNQGSITEGNLEDPDIGDVYDSMAEAVLSRGGQVLILEKEDMPTESDIAGIYRY